MPTSLTTAPADTAGTTPDHATPFTDVPTPHLVRELHAQRVSAADLPIADRQRCVAHLSHDGFSTAEIAELMRVSERTVRRDRSAARKADAVAPHLTLGDELLGEYHAFTLASITRLVRLTHQPDAPVYAKLWAEEAINRMYNRLMTTARAMGYIEPGNERLAHQRATDPQARKRHQQKVKANMEMSRAVWA